LFFLSFCVFLFLFYKQRSGDNDVFKGCNYFCIHLINQGLLTIPNTNFFITHTIFLISQLLFTIPNTNIFISHSILSLNNNLFSNIPNFTKINPNIKTLITKSEKNTISTFRYQWPTSRSQVSTSVFESRLQFLHHFAKNPPPVRLPCVTFPQFHIFITCFCDFYFSFVALFFFNFLSFFFKIFHYKTFNFLPQLSTSLKINLHVFQI